MSLRLATALLPPLLLAAATLVTPATASENRSQ
eukprot:SAG31_NODE_43794_length_265_cov_0.939759_1_plen_32_part_01